MRQPILTLCAAGAAALLSGGLLSLASGQAAPTGFAGAVAAADSNGPHRMLLDDHIGGSVVNLGGGLVEAGVQVGFDKSDVWSQTRGIDVEVNDGAQTFAQADDWDDWIERQVLILPGVTEAADAGPEGSKWALILIAFAGLTAALSGRRRARRAVITT